MALLGIPPRRLGSGLLVFGLVGVVLAGVAALGLFASALATRNLEDRVATEQVRLVEALQRTTASVGRLATTTENAAATLDTSQVGMRDAQTVLDSLAATSDALASALDVSILGQRPLEGAAAGFEDLAGTLRTFSDTAGRLADNLATNSTDVAGIARDLRQLELRLGDLSARAAAFEGAGDLIGVIVGGTLLSGLLVAWIAAAAAMSAWAGWRLRGGTEPARGGEPADDDEPVGRGGPAGDGGPGGEG